MVCRNCGAENQENVSFCTACGASLENKTVNNEAQENNMGNNTAGSGFYSNSHGQSRFYSSQQNTYYNSYSPLGDEKAVPSIKDYLKWLVLLPLVNLIPGIGTVIYVLICLKYALDDSFKARSNFFKATLLSFVIGVAIVAVFVGLIFAAAGFFVADGFEIVDEVLPDIFTDGSFHHATLFMR